MAVSIPSVKVCAKCGKPDPRLLWAKFETGPRGSSGDVVTLGGRTVYRFACNHCHDAFSVEIPLKGDHRIAPAHDPSSC